MREEKDRTTVAFILLGGFGADILVLLITFAAFGTKKPIPEYLDFLILMALFSGLALFLTRGSENDGIRTTILLGTGFIPSFLFLIGAFAASLGPLPLVFFFLVPLLALLKIMGDGNRGMNVKILTAALAVMVLIAMYIPAGWYPRPVSMSLGGVQMLFFETGFGFLKALILLAQALAVFGVVILAFVCCFSSRADIGSPARKAVVLGVGAVLLSSPMQFCNMLNFKYAFGFADMLNEFIVLIIWNSQIIVSYFISAQAIQELYSRSTA